jgi:hypothetical protein
MSMIDPKGSEKELEALAIIRAHRAQIRPQKSSAFVTQPPPLIVLPIPGFWKSTAHQIPTIPTESNFQHPAE